MKTKAQLIIQFHAALRGKGITDKEDKREMVYDVSNGRVTSSADLTEQELQTLIESLNANKPVTNAVNSVENRLRMRIISKFREMGENVWSAEKQKMVANMPSIEEKLVNKWGKLLNEYTKEELTKMIAVLETEWLPNFYKDQSKKHGKG